MTDKVGKILFLGDKESPLLSWLIDFGESVLQTSEVITPDAITSNGIGFLVSYGYPHILKQNILELLPSRAINLHISYLPWNKGADPNFWSLVEDTTKGVTIHYLDEGVDTGDIIVQRQVRFDMEVDTLATSYEKLQSAIKNLFKHNWYLIKNGSCQRHKQVGEGSIHKAKDKESLIHLLSDGWNTSIGVLDKYASKDNNFDNS